MSLPSFPWPGIGPVILPGGWTWPQPPTNQIQGFIDKVKPEAEKKLKTTFKKYQAVTYILQVEKDGPPKNYVVNIDIGEGDSNYVHEVLFVPCPGENEPTVELKSVTGNHKKDASLYPNEPGLGSQEAQLLGGWSKRQSATPQIQGFIDEVKSKAEEKLNAKFKKYQAESYIVQVVAGWNYVVNIDIGEGDSNYVHETLFQPLQGEVELKSATGGHKKDAPLNPSE